MYLYVDNMITKSTKEIDYVQDLEEAHKILMQYRIKLNPRKCTVGFKSGKFLVHMIDQRRIEANPDKVKTMLNMKSLTTVKEVQKLTSCIAVLGRLMPRSTGNCIPFLESAKEKDVVWMG